jgi:hypothetical protein
LDVKSTMIIGIYYMTAPKQLLKLEDASYPDFIYHLSIKQQNQIVMNAPTGNRVRREDLQQPG